MMSKAKIQRVAVKADFRPSTEGCRYLSAFSFDRSGAVEKLMTDRSRASGHFVTLCHREMSTMSRRRRMWEPLGFACFSYYIVIHQNNYFGETRRYI